MRGPEYLITARICSRISGRKQWTVQRTQGGFVGAERTGFHSASGIVEKGFALLAERSVPTGPAGMMRPAVHADHHLDGAPLSSDARGIEGTLPLALAVMKARGSTLHEVSTTAAIPDDLPWHRPIATAVTSAMLTSRRPHGQNCFRRASWSARDQMICS